MLVSTLQFLLYFSYFDITSYCSCQGITDFQYNVRWYCLLWNFEEVVQWYVGIFSWQKMQSYSELRRLTEIAGLNFMSCLMINGAIILNIFSKSELFILKKVLHHICIQSSNQSSVGLLYFFLPLTRLGLTQNLLGRLTSCNCNDNCSSHHCSIFWVTHLNLLKTLI